MKLKSLIVIFFVCAVLMLGVGIIVWGLWAQDREARHAHLLELLPKEVAGWDIKDMPIASTPEMQKAVDEMLNYDEAVFREYTKNGKILTIYAAYWRPFRFHPRLISIHTPDVCWLGNGWTMKRANYNYRVSLSGGLAWHAQERVFEANEQLINVIYWHILDGKLSGYAEGPASTNRSFFDSLRNDLKHGAGEQFFIRISSPQPWSMWEDEPLFQNILEVFSPVLEAHNE